MEYPCVGSCRDNPIAEEEKPGLEERWIIEFEEGHNLEKFMAVLSLPMYPPLPFGLPFR